MFRNRKYKTPRNKSGQSTVEYILIVTAVVATIIIISVSFKTKLTESLNNQADEIATKAADLSTTHDQTFNTIASQESLNALKMDVFKP